MAGAEELFGTIVRTVASMPYRVRSYRSFQSCFVSFSQTYFVAVMLFEFNVNHEGLQQLLWR